MRFEISYERRFLVFGVSNTKYLAFDTPNGNALINGILPKHNIYIYIYIVQHLYFKKSNKLNESIESSLKVTNFQNNSKMLMEQYWFYFQTCTLIAKIFDDDI